MGKKILILFAVPPLFLAAFFYYSYALSLPNSPDSEEVSFTIEPGESLGEIAARLQSDGLIRSAALFQLYVVLNDLSSSLQAGEYSIPQNLNVKEVVAALNHGTFEEKITFIEGWRREEYAAAINSKSEMLASRDSFGTRSSKLNGTEFLRKTEGLEGYLFPDTYFVSPETTTEDLIRLMRENFDKKTKGLSNNSGVGFDEAVIIASIVEREVHDPEEKPIVAGILIKRYQNGWPLQADATVQYALGYQKNAESPEALREGGWWTKNITAEDLKLDSPYNTYIHPGLPPASICNPGLESLRAALNPQTTDYWYYLSDKEGKVHYAVTNEEHNQNVTRFLTP